MNRASPRLRSSVAAISPYRSSQIDCAVRLNTNESPYPPPESLLEQVADAARELEANRYPERSATALRDQLAAHFGAKPEQVITGSGSNEVIQSLLLAYGGEGRRVGIFDPTYQVYRLMAAVAGSEIVVVSRDRDFAVTSDAVDEMILARPDIVILCTPNNPTGGCDSAEVVRTLEAGLPDSLILIDEAYAEFAPHDFGGVAIESANVVSVRTFSKAWSLANFRVGFALGPSEVTEGASKVILPYHVNGLAQAAALLALHFEPEMRGRVARIRAERDRLFRAINALDHLVAFPSEANFVLFGPSGAGATAHAEVNRRDELDDSARLIWQLLIDDGVLVRDCTSWAGLTGCLRVTAGTPADGDVFVAALERSRNLI